MRQWRGPMRVASGLWVGTTIRGQRFGNSVLWEGLGDFGLHGRALIHYFKIYYCV